MSPGNDDIRRKPGVKNTRQTENAVDCAAKIAGMEHALAVAKANLNALQVEFRDAEMALDDVTKRLEVAKSAATRANGRVHLARIFAMLAPNSTQG